MKRSKKELLKAGQTVWLETTRLFISPKQSKLKEMIVTNANKTSAYIWHDNTGAARYKVNQRTHEVDYGILDGCSYRLWLSKESYEQNEALLKETKELREKLHNSIDTMTLSQLRTLHDSISN